MNNRVLSLLALGFTLGWFGAVPPVRASPAEGQHCLGESKSKWVLHQQAVVVANPYGAENNLRLGWCSPLFTVPHVLFDYTHVEFGVANYLTPAYAWGGPYFQITPLSVLQLRAEAMGGGYWAFPFRRAGYYEVSGYDADFEPRNFPAEEGTSAPGLYISLFAIARARVNLGGAWSVAMLNITNLESHALGTGEFFINIRRDVITRQYDWIVSNDAMLFLEQAVTPRWTVRMGGYHNYRWVPASGYDAHIAGGIVMLAWPEAGDMVRNLSPFVRGGVHFGHPFRSGELTAMLGVLVSYDLGF